MLQPEDMKKALTWACLTVKRWGWTFKREGKMIWVNTGSREVGCIGDMDFVSFMSEENKKRYAKK